MSDPHDKMLSAIPALTAFKQAHGKRTNSAEKKIKPPKKVKNPKQVSYYHGLSGKEPFMRLRGSGLKIDGAKEVLEQYKFEWKFRAGRRLVMAWEALLSIKQMIDLLVMLRSLGCEVEPYKNLNVKKVFVLPEHPPASDLTRNSA